MSMMTRCPACATTFRVTSEQLQARHGRVRCGQCSTVFNAFDTLSTVSEEAAAGKRLVGEAPSGESAVEEPREAAMRRAEPGAGNGDAATGPVRLRENSTPHFDDYAPVLERPPRNRPWALGSLLLLLLLAGQAAYQLRTELATVLPGTRPYLEILCEYVSCTVALPQRVEYLNIESSDLKADPGRPGVILLSATLRNNAPFPQGFPALELTLTDTQDQPVARRVFLPADYLGRNTGTGAGIAPNRALDIRLALGITDLPAAGYRLYLFYP
ncbi:MAG: DUF3426 domain-containing protein [Betaproteobacteria bacterium]|nr:DUF3426 domain-containing protein [Betaproteobacteria bacterium]